MYHVCKERKTLNDTEIINIYYNKSKSINVTKIQTDLQNIYKIENKIETDKSTVTSSLYNYIILGFLCLITSIAAINVKYNDKDENILENWKFYYIPLFIVI
jgi:hypothetical protein